MLSQFQDVYTELKKVQCKTCHGLGECDDEELSDTPMNKYTCKSCDGSGFEYGILHILQEER